jgi:hypothetical protein
LRARLSLVVAALAVSAGPARAAPPLGVVMGPVKVRAYQMTIVALAGDKHDAAAINVELDRNIGRPDRFILGEQQYHQEHSFLLDHGVHVRIARNLESASIQAKLGSYGRIDLEVRASLPDDPARCQPLDAQGSAVGSFSVHPGGRYFATIRRTRFPALIESDSFCATTLRHAGSDLDVPILGARRSSNPRLGPFITFARTKTDLFVSMIRRLGRVFVTDLIDEGLPPASSLSVAPDLSSATLHVFGPFVTGVATYTASSPAAQGLSRGTLTGNLVAQFDSPGPLALTQPPIKAVLRHPA